METFLKRVLGVFFSPFRTFRELSSGEKINFYLIFAIIFIEVFSIITGLLRLHLVEAAFQRYQTVYGNVSLINTIISAARYIVFIGGFVWLPAGFLTHLIARIFSKSGSLRTYLALDGFFIAVISLPLFAVFYLSTFFNNKLIAELLVFSTFVYEIFINVVLISIVYKLSKFKSVLVLVLQMLALAIFSAILVFLLVLILFLSRPKINSALKDNLLCRTLGTKLVVTSPPPNFHSQIGCDVEVVGKVDLSKSYCVSGYQAKKASLLPDAYGRANRYYATLTDVDIREPVSVFVYTLSGQKVECLPTLNTT